MVRGYRTFGEFLGAGEGIATNVLATRLQNLKSAGLIEAGTIAEDRRGIAYRLTPKGIALAPVLLELLIWSGRHENTGASKNFIAYLEDNRKTVLAEAYRRWERRDLNPLIPRFDASPTS